MEIKIVERDDVKVLAVRHTGPYPEVGAAFERLGRVVGELGIDPSGCEWLGIWYDDPQKVPAEELRSDACLTLLGGEPEAGSLPEGVRVDTLTGGRFAMAVHEGSYAGLPAAWAELVDKAMPAAGLTCRQAPCFEIYRKDPEHIPEEELVTELYEPVAG